MYMSPTGGNLTIGEETLTATQTTETSVHQNRGLVLISYIPGVILGLVTGVVLSLLIGVNVAYEVRSLTEGVEYSYDPLNDPLGDTMRTMTTITVAVFILIFSGATYMVNAVLKAIWHNKST